MSFMVKKEVSRRLLKQLWTKTDKKVSIQTPNNHSGYVVLLVIFVPSPNKLSLLKKQEQETIINIHIRDSEDVEELKKKV
ncbi:hypothetical protein ACQUIQ_002389, partial [Enterococcus hirae]